VSDLGVNLDKPYAQQPEIQAAAIAYLQRTGNADVMVVLGLVEDPVVAERSRAKAKAALRGKSPTKRGTK
jgi:hypothetical protein